MALNIGSIIADSGMSQDIYGELNILLSPPLQEAVDDAEGDAKVKAQEALDKAREGWKKLSYAVARGVIEHLKANMEVRGVVTRGDVRTTVAGDTGTTSSHRHNVNLSGEQDGVSFLQSNSGTGHVR